MILQLYFQKELKSLYRYIKMYLMLINLQGELRTRYYCFPGGEHFMGTQRLLRINQIRGARNFLALCRSNMTTHFCHKSFYQQHYCSF